MGDMTRLLLLLWAGVSVSSAVDLQKRIIGGKDCKPEERRYHVFVLGFDGKTPLMCGGSLISNQWILTAAHCKKDAIYVYLGVHPDKPNLDPKNRVEIKEHKIYNKEGKNHDLMLLKLKQTIDTLPNRARIKTISLPTGDECEPNNRPKTVEVAGYGDTGLNDDGTRKENTSPDSLQCADIPVVDCEDMWMCLGNTINKEKLEKYQHQDWLCGKSPTSDVSPGDSGGGVVYKDKIYGVYSFHGDEKACDIGFAFINVCNTKYMEWIKEVAEMHKLRI